MFAVKGSVQHSISVGYFPFLSHASCSKPFTINTYTHTHTLLGSSVVTSWLVARQVQVCASLKMQSFSDNQAVTVLKQEDEMGGWCVEGQSLTHRSGYNKLQAPPGRVMADHESSA